MTSCDAINISVINSSFVSSADPEGDIGGSQP